MKAIYLFLCRGRKIKSERDVQKSVDEYDAIMLEYVKYVYSFIFFETSYDLFFFFLQCVFVFVYMYANNCE